MDDAADMAERHGRILGRLSELGMSLAEEIHAEALAAETPQARRELTLAFHRISRSIRQTLALEARLERERVRAAREDLAEAERQARRRTDHRKAQVKAAVERLIWHEAEEDEAERLVDELGERLSEDELYEAFADQPIEAHVARLCADLGVAPSDLAQPGWRPDRAWPAPGAVNSS